MSRHTSIHVSACLYICVRIPLYVSASSRRRAATICSTLYVSTYLYMCVRYSYMARGAVYVSSYLCICVLIPLYMCPHTSIYVSSYLYMCVRYSYMARGAARAPAARDVSIRPLTPAYVRIRRVLQARRAYGTCLLAPQSSCHYIVSAYLYKCVRIPRSM